MAGHPPLAPLLENVLVFGRALRRAGLPVSPAESLGFAHALEWVDLGSREQVFHAARALFVHRREDLELFAALFDRFWRAPGVAPQGRPRRRRPATRRTGFEIVAAVAARAAADGAGEPVADRSGTYSSLEVLRRKDFAELTPEELEAVRQLIRDTRWRASLRETRRRVADPRGPRLHLRRVLREAARHGGSPLKLWRLSRKVKERPVVLLADVSGSMEKYSRLVLQFFYSLSHSLRDAECFVFGTRLTRITTQLRLRNVDRALEEATREIVDFSGGTRIGECLGRFNRDWSRRVLRRGALVVIVSDGWERGDVAELRREMRYLHHRCHRLVWLNPLLGQPGYRPLVEGMAAALPFVDDFLPVHNLRALRTLADHLAALPRRARTTAKGTPASGSR